MIKQTWSIVKHNKESAPVPLSQIRSFDEYKNEVKAEKLANQMLIDNLISQLAEANAVPLINDVAGKLDTINYKLETVHNFFENTPTIAKRISKKERERIEAERRENRLRERALNYIKNGGKI